MASLWSGHWTSDQWPASLCEVITAKKRGENFNPFTGQKLISCSLYHPSRIAAAVLCQTSSHDTNLCHQLPWIKLNQHYVYWSMQGYCKKVDCFSKMERWKCLWREPSADIRSNNDRGLFAQFQVYREPGWGTPYWVKLYNFTKHGSYAWDWETETWQKYTKL